MIGEPGGKPVPPLNLVADFGGGGMLLAFGMLCAIVNARATGKGQVVDAAMLDGVNALASMFHGFAAMGLHSEETGSSFLGGAAHFYDTYETKDGKYVSIAALEPGFYDLLIEKAGLDRDRFAPYVFAGQVDDALRETWAELKNELAAVIKSKSRDDWCGIMEGTDVCFAPVLTLMEAPGHPHNKARGSFIKVGGHTQAAPAPRFSDTQPDQPTPGVSPGTHSRDVLLDAGFSDREVDSLIKSGAVSQAS